MGSTAQLQSKELELMYALIVKPKWVFDFVSGLESPPLSDVNVNETSEYIRK